MPTASVTRNRVFLVLFVAEVDCRDAQTVLERETVKLASTLGACRFIVVNNGLEALEAAETLNLDLIIVQEYVIPMYCMAFVQILRNAGCPVPVIVNKAEHCSSLVGDELSLFCGFICKGYSNSDLCNAISLALDPNSVNRNSLINNTNIHASENSNLLNFNPDKNRIDLEVLNAVTQLASNGNITDYSMLRKKIKTEKCDDAYMASLINPVPTLDHNIFDSTSKTLPDYVDYGFQLMPSIDASQEAFAKSPHGSIGKYLIHALLSTYLTIPFVICRTFHRISFIFPCTLAIC